MLPTFSRPVWWRLDALPTRDEFLPLLELEAAEFTAVLGQPVCFQRHADDAGTDVWDVTIDPGLGSARLESDLEARRLVLSLPDAGEFANGVSLLHSLAFEPLMVVSDTETRTYAEAFDRICAEVANTYPYFDLRGLDWSEITERYAYVRDLEGDEFWDHAERWVANLGDAHTQLVFPQPRFHPPYLAEMHDDGASLRRVPKGTAAWAAGVRPGHRIDVDNPDRWLLNVGASPQHHALVAGRRFLMMSAADPCTLALNAILSPSFLTFLLELLSSGT
jgi:carboxyl-terminal processing protease